MKARKKPVEVECYRFASYEHLFSFKEVIPQWMISALEKRVIVKFKEKLADETYKHWIEIQTLEGNMKVTDGDYIIKGASNELYPCKPDIFEKTYEILK